MKNEQINKQIDDTLNSLDGAKRATPKPFLLTRLTARMQKKQEGSWDNALRFLSRPAVAIACVVLVITVNTAVFTFNQPAKTGTGDEQYYAATEDYNSAVAVLNDIENIEP